MEWYGIGSITGSIVVLTLFTLIYLWLKFVKKGPVYKNLKEISGKTVLITGGNVGIGKETAIALAKLKARVIIACRNQGKAVKAVEDIKTASGNHMVHSMQLDLASLDSIKEFAEEFSRTEPRLDILINNAAVVQCGTTKDGFELMFGTNHVGPFVLTNLLLPVLKKTAQKYPVRIVNVSSDGYKGGKIDFDNLSPTNAESMSPFQVFVQYCNTKLMNIYFTTELNSYLRANHPDCDNITTYSVHPGAIRSRLGGDHAENSGFFSIAFRKVFLFVLCRPTFYGAQTVLYCSLEDGIEGLSGGYFTRLNHKKLFAHAKNEKVGVRLWEVTQEMTGIRY